MRSNLLKRENTAALSTRDAIPRPTSFDATANTVEATIASSQPVQRRDARGPFLEVLDPAGLDLVGSRGASVLDSHQQHGLDAVLGTLDEVRIAGNEVIGTIRFSGRSEVAPLIADVRSGVIRHLSVGYEVSEWRDAADAHGQRTRAAVKWVIREASFVSVPADRNAHTRSHEPPTDRASINRQIRDLGRRAGLQAAAIDALIDREASVDDARNAALDQLLTRAQVNIMTAHNMTTMDNPVAHNRAIADALYSKMTGAAPSGPARDLVHRSTVDIMAHFAKVNGIALRGAAPAEVFSTVMQTRGLSTGDFPILLGVDVMGRRLGELFAAAQSGVSAVAATGTVPDFRPSMEVRLTSFPELEEVPENGAIHYSTFNEEGEQLAIASYAIAVQVSFKLMVNDNLGGLDRSIRDVAFATSMLKSKLIIASLSAVMSDGKALFDASHNNLAGSVSGDTTGLSAGRLAMSKQTPPGVDEPLGLQPTILLVPSERQTEAEKAIAAVQPTRSADVNPFSSTLTLATEPRLSDPNAWYLFAAPTVWPTVRFVTLAGYEQPCFETQQEFSMLGTSYRVHWHVGAGVVDYRGAWKCESGAIL